jgi:DNA repair protein RadC
MKYNAASIILVHNHPSGDPTPSRNDFKTTLSLSNIGKDLDIPITDHIIIGRHGCESIQAVLRRHAENPVS